MTGILPYLWGYRAFILQISRADVVNCNRRRWDYPSHDPADGPPVPVLGMNWGEVGFLADLEPSEALEFIHNTASGIFC